MSPKFTESVLNQTLGLVERAPSYVHPIEFRDKNGPVLQHLRLLHVELRMIERLDRETISRLNPVFGAVRVAYSRCRYVNRGAGQCAQDEEPQEESATKIQPQPHHQGPRTSV